MANQASFAHGTYHGSRRVSRRSGVVAALIALVLFSIGFHIFNPVTNPLALAVLASVVWLGSGALMAIFVGECIANGSADKREHYPPDTQR